MKNKDSAHIEWQCSVPPIEYDAANAWMEQRVADIYAGIQPETIWLLEHPPLYTAGTSAKAHDLIDPHRFPVYQSKRGGQYTYHGPGQRVIYVMLDLNKRGQDVRCFVRDLERWVIATLAEFGITGEIRKDRVGVWVKRAGGREDKIAAIGIRVRKWISFHGISINVHPDLSHFDGIVPCGIAQHGVTSFADMGRPILYHELDAALRRNFDKVFCAPALI